MLCVQFLFWYIVHNCNYGILATPARTIVKTRLNLESRSYLLLLSGLNRLFMSSKVQNQNRTFIGKDNFSCSFLCYIKAMDIIMF